MFETVQINRVDEQLFQGASSAGRSYRFSLRVKTGALMAHGSTDTERLLKFRRYAALAFLFTIRIHSNSERQRVSILETHLELESTRFTQKPDKPRIIEVQSAKNPVQRAIRWDALLQTAEINLQALAKAENVSKALISQHRSLLKLPTKILAYFRSGRDADLKVPFSFRELQRVAEMEPFAAEEYFVKRIAQGTQSNLF